MSEYSLVIAGLSVEFFDRIRSVSDDLIAPRGKVFMSPNSWQGAYNPKHIDKLLNTLFDSHASRLNEDPIPTLLLYVDYGDASTAILLDNFFPFALPHRLEVPDLQGAPNKRTKNELLNKFEASLILSAQKLRAASNIVSHHTDKQNLNPLLLPLRNFNGKELNALLRGIYDRAPYETDVEDLISKLTKKFISKCPWVNPPDANQRAMSDGVLYFKSPGNNRHGFLRNSDAHNHDRECLLNARSRLGGRYPYNLHYDCEPVKGKLKTAYDNCHGHPSAPKERHVNIAPNDFII